MAVTAFSPDGEFLAHLSPDGCLKIWNTNTNTLTQEYIPSSHLTATCVTMTWCPLKYHIKSHPSKKKKIKNNTENALEDLKFSIAMGTLCGDVLIYNVNNGSLHTQMHGGHNDVVTGISWLIDEDCLFSCSKDQHIVQWNISKSTVHTKWKASKTALHSIAVVDDSNLLCASNEIFWWNIKSRTLVKKFIGHATEVFSIIPVHLSNNSLDMTYFISSAINDRVINVWQMEESDFHNSVASFTLSEEPELLDISDTIMKEEPLILSVVTRSGLLHIFQHQLNGRIKKPLLPISTVHLASVAKNGDKSYPISIFSSKCVKSPNTFKLSYGTFLNPIFETVQLNLSEKDNYLIRELPCFSNSVVEGVSRTKVPERPQDVKMLAPGYMTPSKPTDKISFKKHKRKNFSSKELPMEEKLNALHLTQIKHTEKEVIQDASMSNSMAHLLLQGLQSKDKSLLNTVLQKSDDDLVKNTIKRIPLSSIPLLLTELHRRLTFKEEGTRHSLKWLKGIFSIHLSYLMSLQEIDEYIGPVSQLIEAREETYSKMCQLKGFLDVLWSQVDSRTKENSLLSKVPLEYNETSSENESTEEVLDDRNKLEEELLDNSSNSEDSEDDFKFHMSDDEMEVL